MLRLRPLLAVIAIVAGATVARATTFTVVNTNAEGAGSFRKALLDVDADANPDSDTIVFMIPGAAVPVIVPTELPELRKPVLIDGTTQQPAGRVEIRGGAIMSDMNRLQVTATGVTIRGLVLNGFHDAAIDLAGGGTVVEGNSIGTDATGLQAIPNGQGIVVRSANNRIGGTTPAARNVISGNGDGILLTASADGTTVVGNLIGTTADGSAALGNARGIVLGANADAVTIGGLDDGEGNVVSGNTGDGIVIAQGCDDLVIEGNRIGTDAAGTTAVPNARGIAKLGRGTNRIAGNVIAGNDGDGVVVDGADGGLTLQGNLIGTDASGTAALPNGGNGVALVGSSEHRIGGTGADEGNTIAWNGGAGVRVTGTGVENAIRGNLLHDNDGLGIDLGDAGVTANDELDLDGGPNRLQNFPALAPGVFPGGTTIGGTLHAKAGVHYQLDFFASASCDPAGHGEGEVYVGFETTTTNQDGDAAFTITLFRTVDPGSIITATATDPDGNTSELSPCTAPPPTTTTSGTTTTSTTTTTTSTTTTSTTSTTVTTTTPTLATTLPPTTVPTTTTSSTVPTTTTLPACTDCTDPACAGGPQCPDGCTVAPTFASVRCRTATLNATIGALDALGRIRERTLGHLGKIGTQLERATSACAEPRLRPARAALRRATTQLRALASRLRSRAVVRAIDGTAAELSATVATMADDVRDLRRTLICP